MKSLLLLLLPGCLCFPFPRPAPWPIPAAIPVPLPLPLAQHSPPNLYNLPSQSSPILDAAQPRDYKVYKPEVGRVKIQVYRGPNKNKCPYGHGYCDEFAPWGYYNTQPADAKKKKYH